MHVQQHETLYSYSPLGTLHIGDNIVVGRQHGKVRAMIDHSVGFVLCCRVDLFCTVEAAAAVGDSSASAADFHAAIGDSSASAADFHAAVGDSSASAADFHSVRPLNQGAKIDRAPPSAPVRVVGLRDVPQAGNCCNSIFETSLRC
jgi:hypothetical protein